MDKNRQREIELATPLGKDKALFHGMRGEETLSQPFAFHVDFLSPNMEIPAKDLLGKQVTVKMRLPGDKGMRYFCGAVSRFSQSGTSTESEDLYGYSITLRPSIWFLNHHQDCRIFQEKSVPDIIEEVLRDQGITDFEKKLAGSYSPRVYCVQYRESDFAFLSRLMEEEGIYYFFKHEENRHVLVLSDDYSSHTSQSGYATLPYYPPDEQRIEGLEHVHAWLTASDVQSPSVALNDYDFEAPKKDLFANSKAESPHAWPVSNYEIYDYPGEYVQTSDGSTYAKVQREELGARCERMQGETNARGLSSGCFFKLEKHPRKDRNREYLIVSMRHRLAPEEHSSLGGGPVGFVYQGAVESLDSRVQFRPPLVTPQPKIRGPQTAVVVGKKGEEIWTDKHGRVKCQFHWDRLGKSDENSSCWIRVAQIGWAGKRWGGHHVPRIGQEVIVEFLEGDPDQPIITGRVYNGDNMPPYTLPGEQTKSGIKSNSSKGGSGFNEFRFEDKKGEEEIYIHAEKDANRVVQNNDTLKVGFEKKDSGDQTIEIFNNQDITVGCSSAKDGSQTLNVWKDRKATIKTGDDSLQVKMGNHTIKVDAGKSLTQAMQSITLKVGGSSIVVDQKGITMKGPMITIEGQAMVKVKSGGMAEFAAGAINMIKGALVKIN